MGLASSLAAAAADSAGVMLPAAGATRTSLAEVSATKPDHLDRDREHGQAYMYALHLTSWGFIRSGTCGLTVRRTRFRGVRDADAGKASRGRSFLTLQNCLGLAGHGRSDQRTSAAPRQGRSTDLYPTTVGGNVSSIDAQALILMAEHESLGYSHARRVSESFFCLLLAGDGSEAFATSTSADLAMNLLAGCEHYGSEVCSCEIWQDKP